MTILGWIGTILMGCVGLPQIARNYRRKRADDLSIWYFTLLIISCVFLLSDNIVGTWQPTAVAIAAVSILVAVVILGQIFYYRKTD